MLARGREIALAEIDGIPSEDAYLTLASEICHKAVRGEMFWIEWLVWYQPRGLCNGMFLALKVTGTQ